MSAANSSEVLHRPPLHGGRGAPGSPGAPPKIERAWGHGFVHIKLLSNLPVGSGARAEARLAARYLAGYAGRELADDRRPAGLHRYEVGQGFQPQPIAVYGLSGEDVDRARLTADEGRTGTGLVLVGHGGMAWTSSLLGAVGLTTR